MKQFAQERIISSLRANANARWGLDRIIAYARKRKVSGEALIDNAHWRLQLAGLDASWRQSRALAWKAFGPTNNPWPTWPVILRSSAAHEEGGERLYSISTGSDEMMLLSIARAEKWAS